MTDNIYGRDLVIKNIILNSIKCENDIYSQLNITNNELELIKKYYKLNLYNNLYKYSIIKKLIIKDKNNNIYYFFL